jgi:hypothetical protein
MSDGKRPGVVSAFRVPMLLLFLAAAPSAGLAQSAAPPGLPPGVYMGEPDYKPATAGTYALDPDHASVIARVSHIGYSYSIFRFDRLSATLGWDPANTAGASLSVAGRPDSPAVASTVVITSLLHLERPANAGLVHPYARRRTDVFSV